MGIGNLESVLRAYAHAPDDVPIGDLVRERKLSYPEVFFDSGLDSHRKAYELLSGFGDESVAVPVEGARLRSRSCTSTATTAIGSPRPRGWRPTRRPWRRSSTPRTRPRSSTRPTTSPSALDDGDLVPLPEPAGLGWEPDKDIGELAGELDQSPELYRALRPEALATLTYLAGLVREQSGAADAAAGDQRGARPHLPGPAGAVATSRRPPSTRCTPRAGPSTSAATTSRRSRRAASSTSSTTCARSACSTTRSSPARSTSRSRTWGPSCSASNGSHWVATV